MRRTMATHPVAGVADSKLAHQPTHLRWSIPEVLAQLDRGQTVVVSDREHLTSRQDLMDALPELAGRALGCWCAPLACHGDVLVEAIREMTR